MARSVCEDQSCQDEVFPLAISYLDRFLSICMVGKSQLQLLGTACLLLASKLREPSSRGLPAELLVFYTANSITLSDLCSWELLVLSKLKWDVAGVTAHDFLPLLLSRLPLRGQADAEMVRRHAQTFISLAARETDYGEKEREVPLSDTVVASTRRCVLSLLLRGIDEKSLNDYEFTLYSASTLASCCIAAALRGLEQDGQLQRLHELTGIDLDCLQTCLEQIEDMVQTVIRESVASVPNGPGLEATSWSSPGQDKTHSNAATPTDVRDVHF
ncbi:unnamed protein product [Danaus chrysippus]|uniref:(African queen) hypothetical protein n=1 Tax=Danaus chrysippus TaxID=151541 RepID=A0A8J2VT40_9NEOP|nr:unnamed protein product [Danaus chrysippus]